MGVAAAVVGFMARGLDARLAPSPIAAASRRRECLRRPHIHRAIPGRRRPRRGRAGAAPVRAAERACAADLGGWRFQYLEPAQRADDSGCRWRLVDGHLRSSRPSCLWIHDRRLAVHARPARGNRSRSRPRHRTARSCSWGGHDSQPACTLPCCSPSAPARARGAGFGRRAHR